MPALTHRAPPLIIIDHDHIGRILAERHRVGPGYLYDVRQRVKEARIQRHGSYEAARKAREGMA